MSVLVIITAIVAGVVAGIVASLATWALTRRRVLDVRIVGSDGFTVRRRGRE